MANVTFFRGDFDSKIRKDLEGFDDIQELLDLLYKGELEEEKDFHFYKEENDITFFATYFPAKVVDGKITEKHHVVIAGCEGMLDTNVSDEVFVESEVSEVLLVPHRYYLTSKYPSNEANAIIVENALEKKRTFSQLFPGIEAK